MLQWVLFMVVYKICCQNGRLPRTLALFMDSPVFTCPFMHQIKKNPKVSSLCSWNKSTSSRKQDLLYYTSVTLKVFCKYLLWKIFAASAKHFPCSLSGKAQILYWVMTCVMLLMPLALHLIEFKNMDFCLGFFFWLFWPQKNCSNASHSSQNLRVIK